MQHVWNQGNDNKGSDPFTENNSLGKSELTLSLRIANHSTHFSTQFAIISFFNPITSACILTTPANDKLTPLLTLGDSLEDGITHKEFPDYSAFGFTEADIPALVELMKNENYLTADIDSRKYWATTHASRALSQIDSVEVVQPLIDMIETLDRLGCDAAWEEWPFLLAALGTKAIEPLKRFFFTKDQDGLFRTAASEALMEIALKEKSVRPTIISIYEEYLNSTSATDKMLNGFIIGFLEELNAVDSIDIIRKVYAQNLVDKAVCGSLEEVEFKLGLRDDFIPTRPDTSGMDPEEILKLIKQKSASLNNPLLLDDNEKKVDGYLKLYFDSVGMKDISMLDGFFAAIACAKNMIMPSIWLPLVMSNEKKEHDWVDVKHEQDFMQAIISFFNEEMDDLNEGVYEPLVFVKKMNGKQVREVSHWCIGFHQGMQLWEGLTLEDEKIVNPLLEPIIQFALTEHNDFIESLNLTQYDKLTRKIEPNVLKIFKHFYQYRGTDDQIVSRASNTPKVGRNDPCPCGSGKKFKKCCLH